MSAVDIRKGDLVKATSKKVPENTAVFRAHIVEVGFGYCVQSVDNIFYAGDHDFEVLERHVDTELVDLAIDAYRDEQGFKGDLNSRDREGYRWKFTPVVQAVLDHINKESK